MDQPKGLFFDALEAEQRGIPPDWKQVAARINDGAAFQIAEKDRKIAELLEELGKQ